MSLNRKDLDILEELNEKKRLPLLHFSQKYGVSERNIRYIIENINFYLKKLGFDDIKIKKGEAYWEVSPYELENFIHSIEIDTYIFSQEERERYILINYLFSDDTKITDIEKYLKVSRPTIKKDILNLNLYLQEFELKFSREENTILIDGNEKKLRHLKLLKLLDYIEIKDKQIFFVSKKYLTEIEEIKILKKYLSKVDTSLFFEVISEIELQLNVSFDSRFKSVMYLYLIPTLERIGKKNIILRKNNSEVLKNLDDYKIIKNILKKLIPEEYEFEFLHLTEYFISGYYSHRFSENVSIVKEFIEEFTLNISKTLDYDFHNSFDFREEIMKYLLPAVYRIKNNFFLIKAKDTPTFDKSIYFAVKSAVLKSNHILKEPFRDEEILFLTKSCEKYIFKDIGEKISFTKLLSIIDKNCQVLDSENLISDLLSNFKNKIYDDRT